MAIEYKSILVVLDTTNKTAKMLDAYDATFSIEQDGDMFIVTEKMDDMDRLAFETDNLYDALQFVKDWT